MVDGQHLSFFFVRVLDRDFFTMIAAGRVLRQRFREESPFFFFGVVKIRNSIFARKNVFC